MIFVLPLVFGQILDFPGTTYVDNCYPYQCNLVGICTNLTGDTFSCDCYTYYEGDNCETTLSSCDDEDCGDMGTCLYNDGEAKCYCEYGWEREDKNILTSACTVEVTTVSDCDVYDCGGRGTCYMLAGEATCKCDAGWGGDTCSWKNQDVYNMFLLEMAALLIDEYPAQAENIAYDCSYLWPFVWDEAPVAKAIGEYTHSVCAPCNCLSAIRDVAADNSWDTLYQWRLDSKYAINILEIHELHCPYGSTEEQVATFVKALSSFSDDCATVLRDASSIPLYLENDLTCSCLTTVAEYVDDVEDFLKYPLDLSKPFSSAYMNYLACTSDAGICDYEEIYSKIVKERVDLPQVAETCAPLVLTMAKSLDDDEFKEGMCACMWEMSTFCVECANEWFDCFASSWDWVTVEDRFRQMCFHSPKVWREYVWTMNRYAMQLISVDIAGASSCSNALMSSIARAQVPLGIDGKINQTLCDCMTSLANNGFDSAWDDIMAIAPTGYSLDESDCDGYSTSTIETLDTTTTISSESTQLIIMIALCSAIGLNAIWSGRNLQKRKSYEMLDKSKDVPNQDEAVNYKTTEDR